MSNTIIKECYHCSYKQKCCGNCISCDVGIQYSESVWFCSKECQEAYGD